MQLNFRSLIKFIMVKLSVRKKFFSSHSVCTYILLAHTQHAHTIFKRKLSVRLRLFSHTQCELKFILAHSQHTLKSSKIWKTSKKSERWVCAKNIKHKASSIKALNFFAQTQHALTLHSTCYEKIKRRISATITKRNNFFQPWVAYPDRIFAVKKWGRKSHTWAPLKGKSQDLFLPTWRLQFLMCWANVE